LRIRIELPKEATEPGQSAQTDQRLAAFNISAKMQMRRVFLTITAGIFNPLYCDMSENARWFYFLLIKKK